LSDPERDGSFLGAKNGGRAVKRPNTNPDKAKRVVRDRAETTKAIQVLSVWASAFTGKAERFTRGCGLNGKLTLEARAKQARDARKWLGMAQRGLDVATRHRTQGVCLHRKRISVGEMLDGYIKAGCPTRKMKTEITRNAHDELACFKPLRTYFGHLPASGITLGCCDKYRDWRVSGGISAGVRTRGR